MTKKPLPFDPDNDDSVAAYFDQNSGEELDWEEVEMDPAEPVEVIAVPEEKFQDMRRRSEEYDSKGLNLISVRLTDEDLQGLKELANDQGVGHTTMARIAIHRYIADARRAK